MVEGLRLAYEGMQPAIQTIQKMQSELGKEKFTGYTVFAAAQPTVEKVNQLARDKINAVISETSDRDERKSRIAAIRTETLEALAEPISAAEVDAKDVESTLDDLHREAVRGRILNDGVRPDGRDLTTVRRFRCSGQTSQGHGSGLFMRGETHVLTIATLGTPGDAQRMDTLQPEDDKRYIHHYNFPPYSTGEAYTMRGPKRREIGTARWPNGPCSR